jgi:hypothetical protein
MARYVALVQTPSKFVNVPLKMIRADVMVDTMQAAFENRPDRLDGVWVIWFLLDVARIEERKREERER